MTTHYYANYYTLFDSTLDSSKPNNRPRWAEEGWDGLVAEADADPDAHLDAQVDSEDDGNDESHGHEQNLVEAGTTTTMAKAASEVGDERTDVV